MSETKLKSPTAVDDVLPQASRLRSQFEFASAIELLNEHRLKESQESESARKFARLYCDLQRPDLAIETLSREDFLDCPVVLAELAVYHELLGNFEQAEELINDCIDIKPDDIEPQLVLARVLEHQGEYERAFRIAANLLQQQKMGDAKSAIRALYQVAHCLDKLGNFADAFTAATKAKQIQQQVPGAREQSQKGLCILEWAKSAHEQMDRRQIQAWQDSIEQDQANSVHLIGFPRSGTTLLGEKLSRFADVRVASEQDLFLQKFLPQLVSNGNDTIQQLNNLTSDFVVELRKQYFRMLSQFCGVAGPSEIVVDKKPAHLTFLFALLRLTPQSKFIVALRDPRDVVVSCFMRFFPLSDMSASFLSLGTACLVYSQFMSNWLKARQYLDLEDFMEVRYDHFCRDTDAELCRVGKFIGSTLERKEVKRNEYIHSPSFADVRRPVSSSQVGRWRNYEKQLQPFLKTLNPIASALGYE